MDTLGEIIRGLEVELAAAHGRAQRPEICVRTRAACTLRQVSFDPERAQQIKLTVQIAMYECFVLFTAHVTLPSSFLSQLPLKVFAAACQAGHDGPHRYTRQIRYLSVRHPLQFAQN
jgi:hypothetical protein